LLDGSLEDALVTALYDSTRIDPYTGFQIGQLGKRLGAPASTDAIAAALAAHDGNRVLVATGAVEPEGTGYALALAVRGTGLATPLALRVRAGGLDGTLAAAAQLAGELRAQLGDPGRPAR